LQSFSSDRLPLARLLLAPLKQYGGNHISSLPATMSAGSRSGDLQPFDGGVASPAGTTISKRGWKRASA
jgi:hypothetical protein